jgi:hypothetical protein
MWILRQLRQSICRPVPGTILMVIASVYYEKLCDKRWLHENLAVAVVIYLCT